LVEHCLDRHELRHTGSLDELLQADAWARRQVGEKLRRTARSVEP